MAKFKVGDTVRMKAWSKKGPPGIEYVINLKFGSVGTVVKVLYKPDQKGHLGGFPYVVKFWCWPEGGLENGGSGVELGARELEKVDV